MILKVEHEDVVVYICPLSNNQIHIRKLFVK